MNSKLFILWCQAFCPQNVPCADTIIAQHSRQAKGQDLGYKFVRCHIRPAQSNDLRGMVLSQRKQLGKTENRTTRQLLACSIETHFLGPCGIASNPEEFQLIICENLGESLAVYPRYPGLQIVYDLQQALENLTTPLEYRKSTVKSSSATSTNSQAGQPTGLQSTR